MILQALVRLYENLAAAGKIARPGWGPAKVSYALSIGDDGALLDVLPLKVERTKGKKTILAPRIMEVPLPVKRTVDVLPNFLCDNSGYFLGIDQKGNPERTRKCFDAAKELHLSLLDGVDAPAARAVRAFFSAWDPAAAPAHPALQAYLEDIYAGANLVFWWGGDFVHEDSAVRSAWQERYCAGGEGPVLPCLVTGQRASAAILHPSIKGVRGAQSSGASLVSFNATALESYGHEMARKCGQGLNAPVSEYAAFAYGAALNYLLNDPDNPPRIVGDTTVICWAEGAESAYQCFYNFALFGVQEDSGISEANIRANLRALASGQPANFQNFTLRPDQHFYVLGLAPNAARLSVRFFLQDDFGPMMGHVNSHYERLEITRPAYDRWDSLPIWKLLGETVNQKSTDKSASPEMSGEVLRAVLTGGRYPATLLNAVMLRIRAEHEITRGRAAIIKAYYLKNEDQRCPKEVLTVELNDSKNIPYNLGRLFSILEAVQQAANPGINATIKDKYFNSASSTPGTIFPLLINLAQKHLRKLELGLRIYYEKQITPLADVIGDAFPGHLTLPEQGSFQLGYYHQTQKRYEKKEGT